MTWADFFGVLFDPRFWLRNGPVCHEWSDKLELALSAGPFKRLSLYTVQVGDLTVWVGNFPYAYGTAAPMPWRGREKLPRRNVALWLRNLEHVFE